MKAVTSETRERQWPLLTVNILAFNRKAEVRTSLLKLQELDYPRDKLEIIVVDNASSDGTRDMIAAEFPDVKLVVIQKNRGVAGWNEGFKAGTGDYFLVLDDDSTPEAGPGLKSAIEYLEAQPQVGILACNIVGGLHTTEALEDKMLWVGFVGCGAIIRRAVWETIGGYAPWIYLYSHEWEYGLRCLNAGFEIRFFKGCVVQHRASSANRSSRRTVAYTTRNELLIVHTYFERHRPLFLLRTLVHNAWMWRGQGGSVAPFYVIEGFLRFLKAARRRPQRFVSPAVQQFYAATFWSTQPITRRIFHKIGLKLGLAHKKEGRP